ncbi:MAG: sulfate adenylyltransferase [Chloroflexota bacterium]|nr:sulfate adenylyltransferase [Chloroflexota bacterium]
MWADLGQPHGGRLAPRQAPAEAVAPWLERIERDALPQLTVSAREVCDLELLGNGALSPLEGFLGQADYRTVVRDLRLTNGLLWPVPVVLGASEEVAAGLREGQDIALLSPEGTPLAVLHLREKYLAHPRGEAQEVYRTVDEAHPGVAAVYARGPVLLGGAVTVLQLPTAPAQFQPYTLGPAQTRREFVARGWQSVVAFQTRNPVHRAHEYLLKTALEGVDGLLLHPLVGETKADDIPADVRLRCYEALLTEYFPAGRVLLSLLPAAMRYAGPREAIFHALMRKNYGCTHFIVGRDHAGVGNYYGTYDAQRIFQGYSEAELGIRPLFYEHTFYCTACAGMASAKTCPHDDSTHLTLSGTRVRDLLRAGEPLPVEFTRPEVARVLMESVSVTA